MYELSPFLSYRILFGETLCPPAADTAACWTEYIKIMLHGSASGPTIPVAPSDTKAPCLFKEWFRLYSPSTDLIARKHLSLSSPTEPRASLNQLSLPLGDYQGFINEQGALFHTSYQTDHKTPSLGFDCLVTHVGTAPYGNAAGSLSVSSTERMSVILLFFFSLSLIWLHLSNWIPPHTNTWLIHLKWTQVDTMLSRCHTSGNPHVHISAFILYHLIYHIDFFFFDTAFHIKY